MRIVLADGQVLPEAARPQEAARLALAAAEKALEEHYASWEYAYASAGGCHGGAEHPGHRPTRERTERLLARVRAARSALERAR